MKRLSLFLILAILILFDHSCKKDDSPNPPPKVECPGGTIGDTSLPAEVQILGLKPGDTEVHGTAKNINAGRIRIVLWAKTDFYYVQPTVAEPFTSICGDGSWNSSTNPWERMVVLLVDPSYIPGSKRAEHPSLSLGVLAWDEYPSRCLPTGFVGNPDSLPVVRITRADPAWIEGAANNVDVSRIRVVLWAETNMWYVQPWIALPYTPICGNNGSWSNTTHPWKTMVALLVDSTYVPGSTRSHHPSQDAGVITWDQYPR